MLKNFADIKHQNPGQFPGAKDGILFQNQEASSSSSTTPGIERSRILSHSGCFLRPNLKNSSLLNQDIDLSRGGFAQSDNLWAESGLEDLSGSLPTFFQTSSLSSAGFNIPSLSFEDSPRQEFSVLTNDTVSTNCNKSSKSLPYQANYVGLRMSNLKQLTESSLSKTNQGMKPSSGVVTLPGSEFQGNIFHAADQDFPNDDTGLDRLLQLIGDSTCFAADANGGKQLSDIIADYQMLISTPSNLSLTCGTENGREIQESVFASDLVAFDHTMSLEHSLEGGGFRTSLVNEAHFQNQGQQNGANDTINSLCFNAPSQFSTTLLSPIEHAPSPTSYQFGNASRGPMSRRPRKSPPWTRLSLFKQIPTGYVFPYLKDPWRYDFPYFADEIPEDSGKYVTRDTRRIFAEICYLHRLSPSINTSTCVTLNGSGIQLAVGPQPLWLRNHNSGLAHRIMYGPFNPYIPIRSTTIGKSRVAKDPIAMHTSWRSNNDIASVTSIGYPRMSASGESSTTMHRLLHASGSHPIPPPNDPKTNQYNQDLGLIHSTNGNHLESETWYFASQILVSRSGGLILILTAQSTRNMFRIHSDY
ncbi:hypothetical protein F511_26522 [Dorcoceras hygrometricum]|uniref:Uncharacterized protein n=1 Tax=Dorcoceras hygrometricum TaxID=472368 RepID=A0A2Z7DEZ9_9LAMI|nr:hypothetical protein F511_26522 [Dorcoceras hygrometricum]